MDAEVSWRQLRERRTRPWDIAVALAITAGIFIALSRLLLGDRILDIGYMGEVWTVFLPAAGLAVFATTVSYAIGMGIGFLVGWARTLEPAHLEKVTEGLSGLALVVAVILAGLRRFFRRLADFYVETVRGTPLLVQILFAWSIMLVLSPSEWDLASRSVFAGIMAMTINTGGYQGEIFRGGIQTVHSGQIEAARAVGLSRWGTMRHVVLPQALRLVLPPLTNEFIALFKASSLLFIIGIQELTFAGKRLAFFNPKIFEIFLLLTAIYLAVTIPLSRVVGILEKRYRIAGLGAESA